MSAPSKLLRLVLSAWFLLGLCPEARAQDDEASPKVVLRSLAQLEEQLREASEADEKARLGGSILTVGDPLVRGVMKPSAAATVARALESGEELSDNQAAYFGFWMVRALGSISANNERAGRQAGQVLKRLGAADSEKDSVLNLMAALNIKGWLKKLPVSFAGSWSGKLKVVHDGQVFSDDQIVQVSADERTVATRTIRVPGHDHPCERSGNALTWTEGQFSKGVWASTCTLTLTEDEQGDFREKLVYTGGPKRGTVVMRTGALSR